MSAPPRISAGLSLTSTGASALVFAFFLAAGAIYIVVAKSLGVPALWTTTGPLLIISTYAIILGFARYLRLRDDQAGDNLYYLGFLFTLTSLGVNPCGSSRPWEAPRRSSPISASRCPPRPLAGRAVPLLTWPDAARSA